MQYYSKPVDLTVVTAIQFLGVDESNAPKWSEQPEWLTENSLSVPGKPRRIYVINGCAHVENKNTGYKANPGDYVCVDKDGSFYVHEKADFESKFEPWSSDAVQTDTPAAE